MRSKKAIYINRVTVRPATTKSDVEDIRELLDNYHPLGCNRVSNLSFKILHLVAERISQDWLRRYGVPILALETYVDPHHNALMTGVKQVSWESNNNFVLDALKFDMKGLQKSLAGVTDPHSHRWRTDYYQSTIRAKNGPANLPSSGIFLMPISPLL